MLEPPAQSFAADDPQLGLVGVAAWDFRRLSIHRWLIPQRLVWPFRVVMLHGLPRGLAATVRLGIRKPRPICLGILAILSGSG